MKRWIKKWMPKPKMIIHYIILLIILYLASRYLFDRQRQEVDDVIDDQVVTIVDDAFLDK